MPRGYSKLKYYSRPAIDKWIKLKEETGSLNGPSLPPRSWRQIDPAALILYVNENPDCSLSDYATHFKFSITGIWKTLKRHQITRKKRPLYTGKAVKKSAPFTLRK